jgi:hypothetical protein
MEVGPTRSRLSRELRFRERRNEPTLLCKIWFFRREKFDSPVEKSSGSNAITRGPRPRTAVFCRDSEPVRYKEPPDASLFVNPLGRSTDIDPELM